MFETLGFNVVTQYNHYMRIWEMIVVNVSPKYWGIPFHHAVLGLNLTIIVPHLIQLGADPSIADKNGATPLHMAVRNAASKHLIELFLNREAVRVGYCDKQDHYFYPTNVLCFVNSYSFFSITRLYPRETNEVFIRLRKYGAEEESRTAVYLFSF